MSERNPSEATSPDEGAVPLRGASMHPRLGTQGTTDSYGKNLEFIAEVSQIRRDSFLTALRRHQDMIQNLLEQKSAIEGRQDALTRALERRIAAIRNFADITEASNQKFSEAAASLMTDWSGELDRSLPNTEGGTGA